MKLTVDRISSCWSAESKIGSTDMFVAVQLPLNRMSMSVSVIICHSRHFCPERRLSTEIRKLYWTRRKKRDGSKKRFFNVIVIQIGSGEKIFVMLNRRLEALLSANGSSRLLCHLSLCSLSLRWISSTFDLKKNGYRSLENLVLLSWANRRSVRGSTGWWNKPRVRVFLAKWVQTLPFGEERMSLSCILSHSASLTSRCVWIELISAVLLFLRLWSSG